MPNSDSEYTKIISSSATARRPRAVVRRQSEDTTLFGAAGGAIPAKNGAPRPAESDSELTKLAHGAVVPPRPMPEECTVPAVGPKRASAPLPARSSCGVEQDSQQTVFRGGSPPPESGETTRMHGLSGRPVDYEPTIVEPYTSSAEPPQERLPLPSGTKLQGCYAVKTVLGSGGFGITYLAEDENLGLTVVIKENMPVGSYRAAHNWVYPRDDNDSRNVYARALECFYREAQLIARTGSKEPNPHIVGVKTCFKANNTAYYVMDYVEGTPLTTLYGVCIPAEQLSKLLLDLLDGLSYLHRHRICHLDIKPANIFLKNEDHVPVIIDFGAAILLDDAGQRCGISYSKGYSPPEQLRGCEVNETADIYALGATMYRLIAGRTYAEGSPRLAAMPELAARYPAAMLRSIDKAMAERCFDRWQSADEWMQCLKGGNLVKKLILLAVVLVGLVVLILAADYYACSGVPATSPDVEEVQL